MDRLWVIAAWDSLGEENGGNDGGRKDNHEFTTVFDSTSHRAHSHLIAGDQFDSMMPFRSKVPPLSSSESRHDRDQDAALLHLEILGSLSIKVAQPAGWFFFLMLVITVDERWTGGNMCVSLVFFFFSFG